MTVHKSTLAKVALKSLNDLHDMIEENRRERGNQALKSLNYLHDMIEENRRERGNQDATACAMYHAHSASNYIKAIRAVDASLPTWLTRDWAYYKSIRWHNER